MAFEGKADEPVSSDHLAGDQSSEQFAPEQCDSGKFGGRITCGLCRTTRPPKGSSAPLPTCFPLAATDSCHSGRGLWQVCGNCQITSCQDHTCPVDPGWPCGGDMAQNSEREKSGHSLPPARSRLPCFFRLLRKVQEVSAPLLCLFSIWELMQLLTPARGLPWWLSSKESVCNAREALGWEDPPGEGNGNPLQYSCLGNPMNRGAWRATVHGVAKGLDTI